jgi:pyruvate dehydrogenase (quinone)/pyruvate decarboxylase
VSDLIAPDAVISLIAARIRFSRRDTPASNAGLRLTSPRMLATMAPGLPFDIAAQFAYPNRQSIAVVGDGGFAMFMAELNTAVQHRLPIKIILLKNNSLSEVRFEQKDLDIPITAVIWHPSTLSLSQKLAARLSLRESKRSSPGD